MSERLSCEPFPLSGRADGLSCGSSDRSRLRINAARFRAYACAAPPRVAARFARRLIRSPMVPVLFAPRGRNRAARQQRGTAMTKERFDIHQHITDKIISAIEHGAGEFRLPWHRAAGNIMRPINIASKKAYNGVNILALWAYAEASGYSSGTWGTYRQWAESGAQVRKGEKAAFVVFYKELEIAAETEGADAETRLFARATPVFAAEQVDGYQPP